MQTKINSESVISTLKSAIRWKKNETIHASKIPLNLFLDFVKMRFLPKNDLALEALNKFYEAPNDAKKEGKLETWIDIALEENKSMVEELATKIEKVEEFYKKNLLGEKKEEKTTEDLKDIPEIEDDSDDIDDDNGIDEAPSKERPIIVPWDFTKVAEYALEHAIMYSKLTGEKIYLLHLTKSDKEIDAAMAKMKTTVDETYKQHGIKPEARVQTGNILKTITQIANDENAKYVIMGTHGIKGMQKFTGSLALKVIAGTNTPFIVVQDSPKNETVNKVVFPIDHTKENKQKLKQAKILAKYYKAKYILTMPEKVSNEQMKKNMKHNLIYVKKYFAQNDIEYEIVKVKGIDSFMEATLKYVADNKPDMIIVLTTKNINIQDYVLGADEQKVIANKYKIPVMCINPLKVKLAGVSIHGVA